MIGRWCAVEARLGALEPSPRTTGVSRKSWSPFFPRRRPQRSCSPRARPCAVRLDRHRRGGPHWKLSRPRRRCPSAPRVGGACRPRYLHKARGTALPAGSRLGCAHGTDDAGARSRWRRYGVGDAMVANRPSVGVMTIRPPSASVSLEVVARKCRERCRRCRARVRAAPRSRRRHPPASRRAPARRRWRCRRSLRRSGVHAGASANHRAACRASPCARPRSPCEQQTRAAAEDRVPD